MERELSICSDSLLYPLLCPPGSPYIQIQPPLGWKLGCPYPSTGTSISKKYDLFVLLWNERNTKGEMNQSTLVRFLWNLLDTTPMHAKGKPRAAGSLLSTLLSDCNIQLLCTHLIVWGTLKTFPNWFITLEPVQNLVTRVID